MTTAAALTVTPTSGVVFGLAALGRGVDELAAAVARASTVGRGDLQGVERLIRRLESVKLAMIAAVDRDRIAARVGSANTAAWVAESTKTSGGVAAGEVALATALDAELPATRAALADGVLSTRHAAIIATTMRSLPEDLTHADRATVEAKLVRDAKHLEPARLRKAATLALAAAEKTAAEVAAHQEQVLLDQERRAYARATLTMFDHGDGTTTGKFLVPTGAAMVLRKVIDSMTAPRPATTTTTAPPRPNPAAPSAQPVHVQAPAPAPTTGTGRHRSMERRPQGPRATPPTSRAWGAKQRVEPDQSTTEAMRARNADWDSLDWHEKRGRALVDLLEHLPTDRLTGKVATTIITTITLEQLTTATHLAQLSAQLVKVKADENNSKTNATSTTRPTGLPYGPDVGAAPCDTGHHHSTSQARRLACNAGILPAILNGTSVPLDLGREQRLFSNHQRTALATFYDECATIGCTRPYAWTELHHLDPWTNHGPTDLNNAIPLCGHHHRRIHDPALNTHIHTTPKGIKTIAFTPRT
ncbi:MAG: DUF222 domain-containing protein [Actinomycetales bacterium]|nr:DUF222 domain-containing protein [Actinomycetales bacterium]